MLLADPNGLPVVKARLHTVACYAHAEVGSVRDLGADLGHIIVLAVKKLPGACRDGQRIQRQHARFDRLRLQTVSPTVAQKLDIVKRFFPADGVQAGEQPVAASAVECA